MILRLRHFLPEFFIVHIFAAELEISPIKLLSLKLIQLTLNYKL